MSKFKGISEKMLKEFSDQYQKNEKARVIRNALTENDLSLISKRLEATEENPNLFSIDIKTMPVNDQMHSGRCWLFSSMTILREMMAKKYKIKDQFEFSQNYLAFYDTL